jgi:hypothetical protein
VVLLRHEEEQHAWKEGIERSNPLIPFVSELAKVFTFAYLAISKAVNFLKQQGSASRPTSYVFLSTVSKFSLEIFLEFIAFKKCL